MIKQYIETGKIVGTHGIKGMVRVQPWSDSGEFLAAFHRFYTDDRGKNCLEAKKIQPHGNVVLIPGGHSVMREGETIALKSRELALLELFMRNPGRVLTRSQLEEKLYSWDADVSSNAVEVHIHHLRKKLGSQFIRTLHGVGYTLGAAECDQ